ncbi:MAG TPA: hypothetical protein VM492_07100 [Sumerlaeia bacterium]|nr:hypothetical protein [Sumerlaeia bacterium]
MGSTGDGSVSDPGLTIDAFHPVREDFYYPPEEPAQRADLEIPGVGSFEGDAVLLRNQAGKAVTVPVGDSAWGWDVVAVAVAAGAPAAVLERRFENWGLIAYVSKEGVLATIRTAVGRIEGIVREPAPRPPDFEDALLQSQSDLLGEKVLARREDPSFEACSGFLPDLASYTFLSTEFSDDPIAVDPDGTLRAMKTASGAQEPEGTLFEPARFLPPFVPTHAKRGLLGGSLPAIDYAFFDRERGAGWEEIAFAAPRVGGPLEHALEPKREVLPEKADVLVCLREAKPEGSKAGGSRQFFRVSRAPRASSASTPIAAGEFFSELFEFRMRWDAKFSEAMRIDVPERRLADAAYASLARSIIAYCGAAPRYGVGAYAQPSHGTFPPTTISMVGACIDWNLLDRARRCLDYYLDCVVLPDGTFNYYGPAVSEYGQFLAVIARYVRSSGETNWLAARTPKIQAVVNHLLALRRQSVERFPESDARRGLIAGSPEADTREEVDHYFSGNMWTWRGWLEIGRLYGETGDEAMAQGGRQLLEECDALRADILASLEKSVIRAKEEIFVPPIAGRHPPFDRMTESRLASYTNYRYWIEMLSAGFLPDPQQDAIVAFRLAHGGELLGATRFQDHLDNWPFAGYAYGLLLRDRVRRYLLGLYGDLALHRMHGTFSGFEQVSVRGSPTRSHAADFCVPAQLVVAQMVRWMLVFEEPDSDVLWLCRAVPRRWLRPGNTIAVRRAPTRWGLVDFTVTPESEDRIAVAVRLPREDLPVEVRVRLRTPGARGEIGIRGATLNGATHEDFDAEGEFVRIRKPSARALEIAVRVGRED